MNRHRKGLEAIASDPSLIGIRGVTRVELEVPVFKDGRPLTDIDVFLDTMTGLYIAEYKSGHRRRRAKALEQLRMGRSFVEREYGETPRCLYVYGPRYRTIEVGA